MKKIFAAFLILLIYPGFHTVLSGQNTDRLQRSIPEQEGVSSAGILDFLMRLTRVGRKCTVSCS